MNTEVRVNSGNTHTMLTNLRKINRGFSSIPNSTDTDEKQIREILPMGR